MGRKYLYFKGLKEERQMKKYLVCSLNDENYTCADYDFYDSLEEAKEQCIQNTVECMCVDKEDALKCMEFVEIVEDQKFPTWRYDYNMGYNFFVNQIIEIDIEDGDNALVWHHSYDGVDFRIEHIGTEASCINLKAACSNRVYVERGIDIDIYTNQTVVDTGEEWEVWDVIKYEDGN